ncbi:MAG: DUF6159 family protein [Acidimicrobiales bacterium]
MSTWKRSGEMTAKTWSVIKEHPQLLRFPALAAVYGALAAFIFMAPALALAALSDSTVALAGAGVLFFIGAWAATFVGLRYLAGLVFVADSLLRGEPASFDDGMRVAAERTRALGLWALISVVVGWILGAIEGGGDENVVVTIFRVLVATILSAAWSLITFFVLPIIVLEDVGAPAAMKRSVAVIRDKWGDAVTGSFRIGMRILLTFLLPGLVLLAVAFGLAVGAGGMIGVSLGVAVGLVGVGLIIVGVVRQTAARQVFGVALYRYASSGIILGRFTEDDLVSAIGPRKARRGRR